MGPRLKDVEDRVEVREFEAGWIPASMGPRLKDVEDVSAWMKPNTKGTASMGPRLKDVEDMIGSVCSAGVARGFNGATSQGRGRLTLLTNERGKSDASMGPRLKDVEDLRQGRLFTFAG